MPRKREIIIDQDEDIVYYEHHLVGMFVRAAVGFGTSMPDGTFSAAENQNYEQVIIQDQAYAELMQATDTKPAGVFRKEDLWPFIDIARNQVISQRDSMIAAQQGDIPVLQTDQVDTANVKSKNPK